jgi:AcrR family transcriptional regulator
MTQQSGKKKETIEAREALLRAATALFGERGPAAVSTRQIAAAANVNNGLIHRHFRTKEALLAEVLDRLAADIAASSADEPPVDSLLRFLDASHEQSAYWRLLARCILDGEHPELLQSDFPTLRRIVEILEGLQNDGVLAADLDARELAAGLTAMGLGWFVFEPWLVRAARLQDRDVDAVRRNVRNMIVALVTGSTG